MSTVVVTGATGFIGRRLVGALLQRGDQVVALSRDAARAAKLLPGARCEAWEPQGSGPVSGVDGADAVVHLAGEQAVGARWSAAVKREILDSRVRSTEHLVAAMEAAARRPAVLVSASGVGYYGAHGDEPCDEGTAPGGDYLAQVCVAWEAAAARAESLGVRVVRARMGIVLGPGGGALAEMAKPFRAFVGGPIASGRQVISWVHMDDAVHALLRCLDDDGLRGPVNVAAPAAVTNEELSGVIGRVLRRPSAFRVPELALRVRFGEGAEPLVTGQRAVPAALERAGFEWKWRDVEAAVRSALA